MTLIESMVSVALVAVSMGAVAFGFTASARALERASTAADCAMTVLQADTALRKYTGRVRIPYWEREPDIAAGSDDITLPGYGGVAEATLRISFVDGHLEIEPASGSSDTSFRIPSGTGMGAFGETGILLLEEDGIPVGVRYEYVINGRAFVTETSFASTFIGTDGK